MNALETTTHYAAQAMQSSVVQSALETTTHYVAQAMQSSVVQKGIEIAKGPTGRAGKIAIQTGMALKTSRNHISQSLYRNEEQPKVDHLTHVADTVQLGKLGFQALELATLEGGNYAKCYSPDLVINSARTAVNLSNLVTGNMPATDLPKMIRDGVGLSAAVLGQIAISTGDENDEKTASQASTAALILVCICAAQTTYENKDKIIAFAKDVINLIPRFNGFENLNIR